MSKKRFKAEQIVVLLRQIEGGGSPNIAAELLSLVEGIRWS